MRRRWPKIILVFLMICGLMMFISCDIAEDTIKEDDSNAIVVNYEKPSNTVKVGDVLNLRSFLNMTMVSYSSSDNEVIKVEYNARNRSYQGFALKTGAVIIYATDEKGNKVAEYLVSVTDNEPTSITISGDNTVTVGETLVLNASVEPRDSSYHVTWKSGDESIATVSSNGIVRAISSGFVLITASVEGYDLTSELLVYVKKGSYSTDDTINNKEESETRVVDVSTLSNIFEPIITKAKTFVVGVNSYSRNKSLYESASGVIYKRYCLTSTGEEVADDGTVTDFYAYKYYVITCKHVIDKASSVEVYYGDELYDATIIAYDKKIDLGVITFVSDRYFAEAEFADSNDVETGEFVFAFGSNYGEDYFNSATMGVVSYYSRYVSTDTDGDEVSDWDSLYIQHDCAIGDGSSGGPLLNMKGQVIGINSKKISSAKIDNMCFAIPSNLTMELCDQLAQGIVPERPVFKISVLTVVDILKNDYLLSTYPIPEGITYGIYIAEVDEGGVGDKCGMKAGDIIVSFDGKKITYSYELRAAMGEVIIGSGEEINVVVYRDGEYITLKAVF